jgi:hypothetical protein
LLASGKQIAWLAKPKSKRRRIGKRRLTPRNRNARRYWRRLRKRAYLAIWRRRLRMQCRCHECGGDSEINPKKGKPFYYCAACRDKMREWHKLVMRKWREKRKAAGLPFM